MKRRKRQTVISGMVAGTGVVLILIVLWFASKEYRFKKYHNESGGFSISYPVAWSLAENKNDAAVIIYSPAENDLDFFKESVNVVVQDISGNPMALKEYSETAIGQMEAIFGDNMVIFESGPIFVANRTGHAFVFTGKTRESKLQYKSVWVIEGLTAYQVTYTALASQYDRYLPKVDRMIKSFRLE